MDASGRPDEGYALIRTYEGRGMVEFDSDSETILEGDSFAVFTIRKLRRYFCVDEHWHFLWFSFRVRGDVHFEPEKRYSTLGFPGEREIAQDVLKFMRHPRLEYQAVANARLMWLLCEWLRLGSEPRRAKPLVQPILDAIDEMQACLPGPCAIASLSSAAGMSERYFRAIFKKEMGIAPNDYYAQRRLKYAQNMLRTSGWSVSQVADRMEFSSPYHFSKWFKKRTGVSPSQY